MAEIVLGAILEGGETCSADIIEGHCAEVLGMTVRQDENSPISNVCRAIKTFFALRSKFFYTVCTCFYNNNVYKNQKRAAVVMKEKSVERRARLLQTARITL